MSAAPKKEYIEASPKDLCLLAEQYKHAAGLLRKEGKPRKPLTFAPFRLCAIHAIELYLNAFLLNKGIENKVVRGLQHNLTERSKRAVENGLSLKKSTQNHLAQMHESREYLMTRYNPDMTTSSEINQLEATLARLAKKVTESMSVASAKSSPKLPVSKSKES